MGSGGGGGDRQAQPLLGKLSESSSGEHLVKRTGESTPAKIISLDLHDEQSGKSSSAASISLHPSL